jgi:hypothetical protein
VFLTSLFLGHLITRQMRAVLCFGTGGWSSWRHCQATIPNTKVCLLLIIVNFTRVTSTIKENATITYKFQIKKYKLQVTITNYKPQITNHQLQITNHNHKSQITITNHKSQITNHKSQITNYKLQITNYKSQITNYKLQITNYKLQITNNKLQICSAKGRIHFLLTNCITNSNAGFCPTDYFIIRDLATWDIISTIESSCEHAFGNVLVTVDGIPSLILT